MHSADSMICEALRNFIYKCEAPKSHPGTLKLFKTLHS